MSIADTAPDDIEKAERLRAFFDGEDYHGDHEGLSIGATDEQFAAREAEIAEAQLDAVFDDLLGDLDDEPAPAPAPEPTPAPEPEPEFTPAPAPATDYEPDFERIDDTPVLTRYDRARQRIVDAEIFRDMAEPNSPEYHEAMAALAEAKRRLELEKKRDGTAEGRKQNENDRWKRYEGKPIRNASRRKVRTRPNARLKDMTPEERARHIKEQNNARKRAERQRKAGGLKNEP